MASEARRVRDSLGGRTVRSRQILTARARGIPRKTPARRASSDETRTGARVEEEGATTTGRSRRYGVTTLSTAMGKAGTSRCRMARSMIHSRPEFPDEADDDAADLQLAASLFQEDWLQGRMGRAELHAAAFPVEPLHRRLAVDDGHHGLAVF